MAKDVNQKTRPFLPFTASTSDLSGYQVEKLLEMALAASEAGFEIFQSQRAISELRSRFERSDDKKLLAEKTIGVVADRIFDEKSEVMTAINTFSVLAVIADHVPAAITQGIQDSLLERLVITRSMEARQGITNVLVKSGKSIRNINNFISMKAYNVEPKAVDVDAYERFGECVI